MSHSSVSHDDCCPPGKQAGHHRTINEHLDHALALAEAQAEKRASTVMGVEKVSVYKALGRILADDVVAALPIPPFSNSAMDGFAVHLEDVATVPVTLPVVADVPAGAPAQLVPKGAAVRIMTGAAICEEDLGQIKVIPVEFTNIPAGPHELPAEVTVHSTGGSNIRPRSSNVSAGDVVATAGSVLDAGLIAALISAGAMEVPVCPIPSVAVLTSGDELIGPERMADLLTEGTLKDGALVNGVLPSGQIPDSNGPMIAALLHQAGTVQVSQAYTSDTPEEFGATMNHLAATHDMVITTGGVSAGAFDVTHQVAGAKDVWFGKLNMKPGKPQGLGLWDDCLLMCLPGNPVAAWVSFQLFVRPALSVLSGRPSQPPRVVEATAGETFPNPGDRAFAVPVRLDFSTGAPVAFPYSSTHLGSHFVGSLGNVDGIVIIPVDHHPAHSNGDHVRVILTS